MWWRSGKLGRAALASCLVTIAGAKCLESEGRGVHPRRTTVSSGGRVAVIGAGVGGCSASYFLRQLCGSDLDLHVFEKAKVGGRTDVLAFEGSEYESGGAVMHSSNKYLADFAQQFGARKIAIDFASNLYADTVIVRMCR